MNQNKLLEAEKENIRMRGKVEETQKEMDASQRRYEEEVVWQKQEMEKKLKEKDNETENILRNREGETERRSREREQEHEQVEKRERDGQAERGDRDDDQRDGAATDVLSGASENDRSREKCIETLWRNTTHSLINSWEKMRK